MPLKRVLLVTNKWWECDPLLFVLLNDLARPPSLGWPVLLRYPRPRPDQQNLPAENPYPEPQALFRLGRTNVEVWCISDLMEHLPDQSKYQSSSEMKMRYLPRIFAYRDETPALIISFGTAASPGTCSENGNVVAGCGVFLHDFDPDNAKRDSNWSGGPFDVVLPSALDSVLFNAISVPETSPNPTVLGRFMTPPLNPATGPQLYARVDYVGLDTVNVTNPSFYVAADTATLSAFAERHNVSLARSQETTHGLVRIAAGDSVPFLFVSGIANRLGHFADEVQPRGYAQNTVSAHNAAIVASWMLPNLDAVL